MESRHWSRRSLCFFASTAALVEKREEAAATIAALRSSIVIGVLAVAVGMVSGEDIDGDAPGGFHCNGRIRWGVLTPSPSPTSCEVVALLLSLGIEGSVLPVSTGACSISAGTASEGVGLASSRRVEVLFCFLRQSGQTFSYSLCCSHVIRQW